MKPTPDETGKNKRRDDKNDRSTDFSNNIHLSPPHIGPEIGFKITSPLGWQSKSSIEKEL